MKKMPLLLAALIAAISLSSCGGGKKAAQSLPEPAAEPESTPLPTEDPPVPEGSLLLRKYPGEFTAFKIVCPGGPTILLDPFEMDEAVLADFVSVSHGHMDHCDLARIVPTAEVLTRPGTVTGKGATLRGIPGRHDKRDQSVTNVVRLIEAGGYRILHMASNADALDAETIRSVGKVDVLIIQVFLNAPGKIGLDEAAAFAKAVGARVVVNAHGDTAASRPLALALGAKTVKYGDGRLIIDKTMLAPSSPLILADMENAEKPSADEPVL